MLFIRHENLRSKRMKKMLKYFELKYNLIQFKFGRKYYGGDFFLIHAQLCMGNFWSDTKIKSCGSIIIKKERYENK